TPQRNGTLLRTQNSLNLRCQRLKCNALLVVISMHIVDAANAGDDVAGGSLGMIGGDPGPRHQRPRGAPQVMKSPACDTAALVEGAFKLGESTDRALAVAREHITAIPVTTDDRDRIQQSRCRWR